jgi:hypothetical protein
LTTLLHPGCRALERVEQQLMRVLHSPADDGVGSFPTMTLASGPDDWAVVGVQTMHPSVPVPEDGHDVTVPLLSTV